MFWEIMKQTRFLLIFLFLVTPVFCSFGVSNGKSHGKDFVPISKKERIRSNREEEIKRKEIRQAAEAERAEEESPSSPKSPSSPESPSSLDLKLFLGQTKALMERTDKARDAVAAVRAEAIAAEVVRKQTEAAEAAEAAIAAIAEARRQTALRLEAAEAAIAAIAEARRQTALRLEAAAVAIAEEAVAEAVKTVEAEEANKTARKTKTEMEAVIAANKELGKVRETTKQTTAARKVTKQAEVELVAREQAAAAKQSKKNVFQKHKTRIAFYSALFAGAGTVWALANKELKDKQIKFKIVLRDFLAPLKSEQTRKEKVKQMFKEYPKTSLAIITTMLLGGTITTDAVQGAIHS